MRGGFWALAAWLAIQPAAAPAGDVPVIAAASDLTLVMEAITAQFSRETGRSVRLSYGSSGNLTRQILQGAPYELFLSADESYVQRLAEQGLTLDEGTIYAEGHIGFFIPERSPLAGTGDLAAMTEALGNPASGRIAIANPEHAPYGRAAREVLQHMGLWDSVIERLLVGESAAQAAEFTLAGPVSAGLLPASLASTARFAARGRFVPVPREWHAPIRQRMVLLRNAGETARLFYQFMQNEKAKSLLRQHGFDVPGSP